MLIKSTPRCRFPLARLVTSPGESVGIRYWQGYGVSGTRIFCWWDWTALQPLGENNFDNPVLTEGQENFGLVC